MKEPQRIAARREYRIIDDRGMVWAGPLTEVLAYERMESFQQIVPRELLKTLRVEGREVYEEFGPWEEDRP